MRWSSSWHGSVTRTCWTSCLRKKARAHEFDYSPSSHYSLLVAVIPSVTHLPLTACVTTFTVSVVGCCSTADTNVVSTQYGTPLATLSKFASKLGGDLAASTMELLIQRGARFLTSATQLLLDA